MLAIIVSVSAAAFESCALVFKRIFNVKFGSAFRRITLLRMVLSGTSDVTATLCLAVTYKPG